MFPSVCDTELGVLIKKLVFERFFIECTTNKSYFKFMIANKSSTKQDRFIINMFKQNKSLFNLSDISDLMDDDSYQDHDNCNEYDEKTKQKIYNSLNNLQEIFNNVNFDHVDKNFNYDIDSLNSVNTDDIDDIISNVTNNMNSMERLPLAIQSKVQSEIIRQAKLAFQYSRKEKNIAIQIETERIILLARLKRNAIIQKMNNIDDEVDGLSIFDTFPVISINDVTLKRIRKFTSNDNGPIYNFLIVALHKNKIFASKLIEFDRDLNFELPGSFLFHKLPLNFEVNIEVFVINKSNFINESSRLQKHLLPKNWFKKDKRCTSKNENDDNEDEDEEDNDESLKFRICSHIVLRSDTLSQQKEANFSVRKNFEFQLNFNLDYRARKSGFITTCFNEPKNWNRYWCVLKNYQLHFWMYPSDETLKVPYQVICLTDFHKVEKANRISCLRNHTLVLKRFNYGLFLKIDNSNQLEEWYQVIDYILPIARSFEK